MCLFLLHYALQGLEMSKRHCNAKVAFVLTLSILRIFELLSIKQFVISSFLRRLKYKKNMFFIDWAIPSFWPKRASFDTQESLFFLKVGKVTFFCSKSLSCRYSALSLHSKTVGIRPISDSFSQSAPTLPSLWVRSAFALPSLPEAKRSRK